MQVYVKLFATLRKYGPVNLGIGESFIVDLDLNDTLEKLLVNLKITSEQAKIIMVNGVTVHDRDHRLKDGDLVSIFPPVGGGYIYSSHTR